MIYRCESPIWSSSSSVPPILSILDTRVHSWKVELDFQFYTHVPFGPEQLHCLSPVPQSLNPLANWPSYWLALTRTIRIIWKKIGMLKPPLLLLVVIVTLVVNAHCSCQYNVPVAVLWSIRSSLLPPPRHDKILVKHQWTVPQLWNVGLGCNVC
jgi:hypothetical protein